jgi:hypothetical protein
VVLSRRPHRGPAFRSAALALATAALLLPAGCSRAPLLARGPLDLTTTPVSVPFAQPVAAAGPTWELTFAFDRPGDSHVADCLHVALVDASGRRHALVAPRLDRRGESMVCLIGALEAAEATTHLLRLIRQKALRDEIDAAYSTLADFLRPLIDGLNKAQNGGDETAAPVVVDLRRCKEVLTRLEVLL